MKTTRTTSLVIAFLLMSSVIFAAVRPDTISKANNPKQEDSKIDVKVRPNPVKDYFILTVEGEDHSQVSFQIVNALGQTVYSRTALLEFDQFRVDVSDFDAGFYFLCIKGTNSVASKKFIVLD